MNVETIAAGLVILSVGVSGAVFVAAVRRGSLRERRAVNRENDRRILRARGRWGDRTFYCRIDEIGLIRMITPDEYEVRRLSFGPLGDPTERVDDDGYVEPGLA